MRLIDYQAAEVYSSRLAELIKTHLGAELYEWRFIPIPRGGLIVLGMLSYLLNLKHDQLMETGQDPSRPVVIVDDISLSGARFASFLSKIKAERIIFAHLFSHPGLRQAILDAEPRVKACLAAADLDTRPGFEPENIEEHETRQRQRLGGTRYWLRGPEAVSFAWSTPDLFAWDERRQRMTENWFGVSPRACLKARAALDIPLTHYPPGPLDIPPHVQWQIQPGSVYLKNIKDERLYGLEGISADMWRALAAFGSVDQAVNYLLDFYDVGKDRLFNDLKAFADDLLARGLIEIHPCS